MSRYQDLDMLAAVRSCDTDRVSSLIKAGCDIDEAGPEGKTPLMEAAEHGSKELVGLLLENGAGR